MRGYRAGGSPRGGPGAPPRLCCSSSCTCCSCPLCCRVSWRSISRHCRSRAASSQYTSLCCSSSCNSSSEKATCCWCCSSRSVTTCPQQPGSAPSAGSLHPRLFTQGQQACGQLTARAVHLPPPPWRRGSASSGTHFVEVLAEQGSGLRGREVAELGHEVHLALGQQGGRGPQHPLAACDGLVLVLNGGVQGLNGLIQLEQRSLLLQGHGDGWRGARATHSMGHLPPKHRGPGESRNGHTQPQPSLYVPACPQSQRHPRPLQQEQRHVHLSLGSGVGEARALLGSCSLKLTASGVTCAWETLL